MGVEEFLRPPHGARRGGGAIVEPGRADVALEQAIGEGDERFVLA
jgi:hypothetical protein